VFLAFAAHIVLVEGSPGVGADILVSAAGIVLMIALARLIAWYQRIDASTRDPAPRSVPARAESRGRSPGRARVLRISGLNLGRSERDSMAMTVKLQP
jgi:hypothetical protein